jgi:hypothetical protein
MLQRVATEEFDETAAHGGICIDGGHVRGLRVELLLQADRVG